MAGIDISPQLPELAGQAIFSYAQGLHVVAPLVTGHGLPLSGDASCHRAAGASWRRHRESMAWICSESDRHKYHRLDAVPEGSDAIRIHFAQDEQPAVVFGEQALPGALVSWAWCQLKALDALLSVGIESRSELDEETGLTDAVRTVLMPVINALEFAERRAEEIRKAEAERVSKVGKDDPGKGDKPRKGRKASRV